MGAFIVAGAVFVVTLFLSGAVMFAGMMSDDPTQGDAAGDTAVTIFCSGMVVVALIVGSHFLPHIGW